MTEFLWDTIKMTTIPHISIRCIVSLLLKKKVCKYEEHITLVNDLCTSVTTVSFKLHSLTKVVLSILRCFFL